jgi:hypothetical protein
MDMAEIIRKENIESWSNINRALMFGRVEPSIEHFRFWARGVSGPKASKQWLDYLTLHAARKSLEEYEALADYRRGGATR